MSHIKNALLDLEIVAQELQYRRDELSTFKADNQYTRGGSYPKRIMEIKTDLAASIIRLHSRLLDLNLTRFPIRSVKISRNRYAYQSDTRGIAIATKTAILDVQRS
jgi:hypothetical protein